MKTLQSRNLVLTASFVDNVMIIKITKEIVLVVIAEGKAGDYTQFAI